MRIFALPVVILASLVLGADAACSGPNARTSPPAGATVVDSSGKYDGSFRTIVEAVENLPDTTEEHTLFIFPSVYHEQVLISEFKGPLVLQGYTCDTMSYAANQVTITHAKAQKDIPPEITKNRNDLTSTLRLKIDNMKVYNLNVANTVGKVDKDGQGLAVNVAGDNYGFYGCNFTGYQDTVCANTGRELFAESYIGGAVDFVFGAKAQAWFESCDIETVGPGAIAANGRDDEDNPSFYVFNNANVFGSNVAGSSFLGRPWRPYSRVVWQNSDLSDVINPEGWQKWNGDDNTGNVYFKEFKNTGPGAATDKRVPFSGQLESAVAITEILGKNYAKEWFVDTKYL